LLLDQHGRVPVSSLARIAHDTYFTTTADATYCFCCKRASATMPRSYAGTVEAVAGMARAFTELHRSQSAADLCHAE